jgi:hypothetical protein
MRQGLPGVLLFIIGILLAGCLASPPISSSVSLVPSGTPTGSFIGNALDPVATATFPRSEATTPESFVSLKDGDNVTAWPTPADTQSANLTITPTAVPQPSAGRVLQGYLSSQVSILQDHMPRADSEAFAIPLDAERTIFANVVRQLEARQVVRAVEMVAAFDYELAWYKDWGDHGATSFLLRELEPIRRGWGLYVLRSGKSRNLVIEAPHPLFDRNTPTIAMTLYQDLDARALLIAGTHRFANRDGSADVARSSTTIFQAVHNSLVSSDAPVVLQIHGFLASNHRGYPQVVLSSTQENAASLLKGLAEAMLDQGIQVGVCNGTDWRDLCGSLNAQAASIDSGIFVHVELDESIRNNPDVLIGVFTRVFK